MSRGREIHSEMTSIFGRINMAAKMQILSYTTRILYDYPFPYPYLGRARHMAWPMPDRAIRHSVWSAGTPDGYRLPTIPRACGLPAAENRYINLLRDIRRALIYIRPYNSLQIQNVYLCASVIHSTI